MSSPLESKGTPGKPQVVKKKRGSVVEKDSGDEDEEWLQEFFDKAGPRAQTPTKDPSAGAAPAKQKHKRYFSKLLGCYIQAERKRKKPKVLVLCELFGMFLKHDGIAKDERLEMIKVVVQLLRKDKMVNSYAPIRESVRQAKILKNPIDSEFI